MAQATLGRLPAPTFLYANRGLALQLALVGLMALLVLAPLLPVVFQSFLEDPLYDRPFRLTLSNYAQLLTSARLADLLWNSLLFAVGSTLVAQLIGAASAIIVGRTDIPLRGVLGDMLLWPLFVSHLVLGFGWFIVFGPSGYGTLLVELLTGIDDPWNLYSIAGMAIVAGVAQAPLAFIYCLSSTTAADPSLEDAARISGAGPMRTLWSISLPLIKPAILYSSVLNFTICLEMLAIPLLFGRPSGIDVFTTYLYVEGITAPKPDYGLVGTAAVVLFLIVTGLVWLQGRMLRDAGRFVTVRGKAIPPRPFRLHSWRWPLFALVLLYLLVAVVLPFGGLVLRAVTSFISPFIPPWELWTLEHLKMVFAYPSFRRSIVNTLVIAAVGGAIATAFVICIALVTHRSEFRGRRALEFLALYPRAIPGIIVGIGFFYAAIIVPPMGWLRNTIWILVIAYTMRYIPTGYGAIVPGLMQVHRDLDLSARTAGADWITTSRRILVPLIKPAVFSCYALMFIHFFKEYVSAVFLFAPGSEVIGTTMLTFWIQGDTGPVAALALIQIILTVLFVTFARRALGAKIYG